MRIILRVVALVVGNLKPLEFAVENCITGVLTVVNRKPGEAVVDACESLLVGNRNPGLRVVVVLAVVVNLVNGFCVVVVVVVVLGGLLNGLCVVVVVVVVVGGLVIGSCVVVAVVAAVTVVVGDLVVMRGEVNATRALVVL